MNSAVLSLFSTGKTTGIVIESGQGVTHAVPIFEGYALPHAIQSMDLAGVDVTEELLSGLVAAKFDIDHNYFEYVREIKEQMCEVAFDYQTALKRRDTLDDEQRSYELPDGKGIIKVDHKIRLRATEILFNPSIIQRSSEPGVAKLAANAFEKCDSDL